MDFNLVDMAKQLFQSSGIKFNNDWANDTYFEMITELNNLSKALYTSLTEGKKPLENVAITLDFMMRRTEIKLAVVRQCLEMDAILDNLKTPVVVVDKEGKVDA